MKEQELINKVQDYLLKTNTIFVDNSIEYTGVRENHIISNENPKDYYLLSYHAIADKNDKYSTKSYFVLIDKISEKISYIIGPQSFKKVEE